MTVAGVKIAAGDANDASHGRHLLLFTMVGVTVGVNNSIVILMLWLSKKHEHRHRSEKILLIHKIFKEILIIHYH
jgi:hypothetical protein